ncbi:MAG: DUF2852 domain-containing protein [Alphaproteobacteria bacterium]|nr:DUF2852 domain-containing protein [Alphaproteobacteria bacterium]
MELAQRVDEYGKAGWITLMVLSFIIFWPVGLAVLGYTIWSGRMGSWSKAKAGPGRWYNYGGNNAGSVSRCSNRKHRKHGLTPTGNAAFDEYREQTMQRLEEEQQQFQDYLERLRQARDKEEFDSFMADRKAQADTPDTPDEDAPQPAAQ